MYYATQERIMKKLKIFLIRCKKNTRDNQILSKSCQKTTTLTGQQPSLKSSQSIANIKDFQKDVKLQGQGQKLLNHLKGIVTRNAHLT